MERGNNLQPSVHIMLMKFIFWLVFCYRLEIKKNGDNWNNKNSHMILEHASFVMHAEIWNGPINFVSFDPFRRELWPNNEPQLLLHRHMHVCATNGPFKANLLDCRPCCCRHLSHLCISARQRYAYSL
jgi:hypothetical protein